MAEIFDIERGGCHAKFTGIEAKKISAQNGKLKAIPQHRWPFHSTLNACPCFWAPSTPLL